MKTSKRQTFHLLAQKKINADNANYQNQPASNRTNEDRWLIALILCILVGSLGVHRFYTGNIVTGVLMLITLGGCGVWTIIDLIMIAANTYRDGNGNTLK